MSRQYIDANAAWIPNYGERYRHGKAISNAFVESAVNQIVSIPYGTLAQASTSSSGASAWRKIRRERGGVSARRADRGCDPFCHLAMIPVMHRDLRTSGRRRQTQLGANPAAHQRDALRERLPAHTRGA